MNPIPSREPQRSFAMLRGLARRSEAVKRCELCGAGLSSDHQHLVEPVTRKLVCACHPCTILFPETADTKYRRVPRRSRWLTDFTITGAQWDTLLIPIGMAFFLKSSVTARVSAFYPSPAGPTESTLSLDSWNEIVDGNPSLNSMQPDVEALLVNRIDQAGEYFLAPIDKCYELVGLIRAHWRGLSGGTEVWHEIRYFFDKLKEGNA